MAKADSTSSRSPVRNEGAAESQAFEPLSRPILRFNEDALADHSHYLAYAVRHLNRAFETAGAVSAIARIVRRSQLLAEDGQRLLGQNDEDHLLSAIDLLGSGLADDLDAAADYLDEKFSMGDAQ